MTDIATSLSPASRRRRLLAAATVFVLVATSVGYALTRNTADAAEVDAEAPSTATVDQGDLVVSESLDGTVENVDQIQVIHRLDEVSVATGASTGTTGSAAIGSTNGAATTPIAANVRLVQVDDDPCVAAPATDTTAPESTAPESTTTTVSSSPATETTNDSPATVPESAPTPSESTTTTGPTSTTHEPQPTPTVCDDGSVPDPGAQSPVAQSPVTGDTENTENGVDDAPASGSQGTGQGSGGVGGSGAATTGGGAAAAQASTEHERITSVATAGSSLSVGDILYTVDGVPVFAMLGDVPAWRDLSSTSDDGVDILQLETSLAFLGYDNEGSMEIDGIWDAETTAAVREWQLGRGVVDTGEITLGDVSFLPESATVESVGVTVGDDVTDGSVILTITAERTQIRADVPADLQSLVRVGTIVTIGDSESRVERLVSGATDGAVVVQAIVVPESSDQAAGTAVTLRFTETVAVNSLIVPADAIASQLEGTYAVRLARNDRPGEWVVVTPIAVVGGDVAVESESLRLGDTIIVP